MIKTGEQQMNEQVLQNYINGKWVASTTGKFRDVANPATADILAKVPVSSPAELDEAVQLAHKAFHDWRRVPVTTRIQYMFKLKELLEANFEDLARSITLEHGKTLDESRGEMRRAIENVEVACGAPTLIMGDVVEDIAPGIDEYMIRQPLGVAGIISPFNFPAMIAFWFIPYAVATGNTVVVKPSSRVPITMVKLFRLMEEAGFPAGVVNMVHGGAEIVDAILDHPLIKSVSFVGSTPVAMHVFSRGSAHGKRVSAGGGAKCPVLILPDADIDTTTNIMMDSAFGCSGQRCLAATIAIMIGEADKTFIPAFAEAASKRVTGYGLKPEVQMGPVITPQDKVRIEGLIQQGLDEGAEMLVDGRNAVIPGYENGNFIRPTILTDIPVNGIIATTEIFGPVLGIMRCKTIEEAIKIVNNSTFGNAGSIFTSNGSAARKFRYEADAGNIGVNIGIAAPLAFFPFSGWKDSFFGDLHGQGKHAIEFFTLTKVVIERWPKEWSRKF
ncbi:MAG: CoA-acylating methylmalonate-semialdehyde dehydrogenase [Anaerolineales bacterium]|nr:CoA-acylating methylmalonate-semialdehyde dehydrogenase [Anaerolineales bacterium]